QTRPERRAATGPFPADRARVRRPERRRRGRLLHRWARAGRGDLPFQPRLRFDPEEGRLRARGSPGVPRRRVAAEPHPLVYPPRRPFPGVASGPGWDLSLEDLPGVVARRRGPLRPRPSPAERDPGTRHPVSRARGLRGTAGAEPSEEET